MSSFTKPLIGEILDSGDIKLIEEFSYYLTNNKNYVIIVPKGFQSDFATVPKIFQMFVSKIGKHSKPAVLHDYLCQCFFEGKNTRKFADEVFFEAMTVKKVNIITKYLAYWSVRLYAICKRYK